MKALDMNKWIFGVLGLICSLSLLGKTHKVDLAGEWSLRLDPNRLGIQEEWWEDSFQDPVELPGSLQAQGYGERPGPDTKWFAAGDNPETHPSRDKYARAGDNFKITEFLMPRHHYIGKAWYAREFKIPESFDGKRIFLSLERCHWKSTVWVDGVELGSNDSLAVPHVYDLSLFDSGTHHLTICVDNGKIHDIGSRPHSISDQTQGSWNGIVGDISLVAVDQVSIESIAVYPDLKSKSVEVVARLLNPLKLKGTIELVVDAIGYNAGNHHDPEQLVLKKDLQGKTSHVIRVSYPIGENMQLWDEFDPKLYQLNVSISGKIDEVVFQDDMDTSFGMREFTSDGKFFYVNGIQTYLRGNVDCAIYPRTAYAPMSVEQWKKVLQIHKDFGLNHVRFHSWWPPKQAFIAADELGVYLAPEVHEWSWVKPGAASDYLLQESYRALDHFGNHASFVMMGLGNEMGMDTKLASDFIDLWKHHDDRHLYTIKASIADDRTHPENIEFEVLSNCRDEQLEGGRIRLRYQAFWPPLPKNSDLVTLAPQTHLDWREGVAYAHERFLRPLIAHETAQFCAYPDLFNEMKKYTGYLRPTYLEIAVDQLEERGMTDQLQHFVRDSGKWQVELTREEMEAHFRTPELAGFQWLALNDFPGQNTAPVGFTDAFYESKSYVDAKDMRRFCGPTVLLARFPKRVYTNDEKLEVVLEVTHSGKTAIDLSDLEVVIRNEAGKVIKEELFTAGTFNQGTAQNMGRFILSLNEFDAPEKYNLEMRSKSQRLANDWNFWVYHNEEVVDFPKDVYVAYEWNEQTKTALNEGIDVLILPRIGSLKGNLPSCFTTFYWTSFGELGGQSSACGITMDNNHPLFDEFPTDTYANWQWWELLTKCQPMILDEWERECPWPKVDRPLIQPIDSWKLNRKLGLIVEAKVGNGKLLICSMDIEHDLESRTVARQFRKSLIHYLESDDFDPLLSVDEEIVEGLFAE